MARLAGRNINNNDVAVLTSVTLNSSTSTKVSDACSNGCRFSYTVENPSGQDVWIKFQAASVDNDKKGYFLAKRSFRTMVVDNVYRGEVSAIAVSGTPTIFITEY